MHPFRKIQCFFFSLTNMMEPSIPVSIPSHREFHRDNSQSLSRHREFHRGNSHSLSRKSSTVISGSFFCASSVNHPRNYGVSIPGINDPCIERKLTRTRKMSESIRKVESKSWMATIPTQKEDITPKWIHMILNQTLLKSGKAPLDKSALLDMDFQVFDCKSR